MNSPTWTKDLGNPASASLMHSGHHFQSRSSFLKHLSCQTQIMKFRIPTTFKKLLRGQIRRKMRNGSPEQMIVNTTLGLKPRGTLDANLRNKASDQYEQCTLDRFTKTFFWNFQNSRADLCYILIYKKML